MFFKEIFSKILIFFTKFIPRGIPLPILRGPLKGFKLISGAAAGPGKGLSIIFNLSEPDRLNIVDKIIPKNSVCLDVGANIGIYCLLFAKYAKKVYAFEPLPRNLMFLRKMMILNNITNVSIMPSAVANENSQSWFKEGNGWATGSLDEQGHHLIPITTLNTFSDSKQEIPNILKIDVEGTELSVLEGSRNLLLKAHPIIIIEIHGNDIKKACFKILQEMKYRKIIPLDSSSIEDAKDFIIK